MCQWVRLVGYYVVVKNYGFDNHGATQRNTSSIMLSAVVMAAIIECLQGAHQKLGPFLRTLIFTTQLPADVKNKTQWDYVLA